VSLLFVVGFLWAVVVGGRHFLKWFKIERDHSSLATARNPPWDIAVGRHYNTYFF